MIELYLTINSNYQLLTKIFGEPKRKIFCFREPNGYIASAAKKFADQKLENLKNLYLRNFLICEQVGGDIMEYHLGITD